jgi:hypothetical protein
MNAAKGLTVKKGLCSPATLAFTIQARSVFLARVETAGQVVVCSSNLAPAAAQETVEQQQD